MAFFDILEESTDEEVRKNSNGNNKSEIVVNPAPNHDNVGVELVVRDANKEVEGAVVDDGLGGGQADLGDKVAEQQDTPTKEEPANHTG